MPIYEYKCEDCETVFEKLQRKDERVICPSCSGTSSKKLFSVFAKGSSSELPSCEGSVPTCAPSRCGTGACGMNMGY